MPSRLKMFVRSNKVILLIIAGVLIVAGAIITVVLVTQNSNMSQTSEQLQQSVEEETESLETQVGDLMTLPEETPILMTVSDKSQLTDEIFKNAEDGDKVLVYENAGIMVVYRESTKEIIAQGKVKTGSFGDEDVLPTGVAE